MHHTHHLMLMISFCNYPFEQTGRGGGGEQHKKCTRHGNQSSIKDKFSKHWKCFQCSGLKSREEKVERQARRRNSYNPGWFQNTMRGSQSGSVKQDYKGFISSFHLYVSRNECDSPKFLSDTEQISPRSKSKNSLITGRILFKTSEQARETRSISLSSPFHGSKGPEVKNCDAKKIPHGTLVGRI